MSDHDYESLSEHNIEEDVDNCKQGDELVLKSDENKFQTNNSRINSAIKENQARSNYTSTMHTTWSEPKKTSFSKVFGNLVSKFSPKKKNSSVHKTNKHLKSRSLSALNIQEEEKEIKSSLSPDLSTKRHAILIDDEYLDSSISSEAIDKSNKKIDYYSDEYQIPTNLPVNKTKFDLIKQKSLENLNNESNMSIIHCDNQTNTTESAENCFSNLTYDNLHAESIKNENSSTTNAYSYLNHDSSAESNVSESSNTNLSSELSIMERILNNSTQNQDGTVTLNMTVSLSDFQRFRNSIQNNQRNNKNSSCTDASKELIQDCTLDKSN